MAHGRSGTGAPGSRQSGLNGMRRMPSGSRAREGAASTRVVAEAGARPRAAEARVGQVIQSAAHQEVSPRSKDFPTFIRFPRFPYIQTCSKVLDSNLCRREPFVAIMLARALEIIPAAGLALSVTAVLCGLQLMPFGEGMLLVRVHGDDPRSALRAAAMANAAFVSIPAPGFVVVYGEASKVRAALGLAVPWKGNAPCSPTS